MVLSLDADPPPAISHGSIGFGWSAKPWKAWHGQPCTPRCTCQQGIGSLTSEPMLPHAGGLRSMPIAVLELRT